MNLYLLLLLTGLAWLGAAIILLALRSRWMRPDQACLGIWAALIGHRNLLPRQLAVITEISPSDPLVLSEAFMTVSLFLLTVILLATCRNTPRKARAPTLYLLIVYAAAVTLTCGWSRSILYSAFWTMRLWCVALLPYIYFRTSRSANPSRQFFHATVAGLLPVLAMPWIGLFTTGAASDGRVYAFWVGAVMPSIVGFALVAGYVVTFLVGRVRAGLLLMSIFAAGAAILGGSKNGFVTCVGAAVLVLLFNLWKLVSPKRMIPLALLAVIAYAVMPPDIGLRAHLNRYGEGSQSTVRDRLILWREVAIPRILESAAVGRGFASSSIDRLAVSTIGWEAGHTHNSFLNSLMEVGVLGTAPLVAMLVILLGRLSVQPRRILTNPETAPLAAAWICLFLCGLGELIFGGSIQPAGYLFYGLTVSIDVATAPRGRFSPAAARAGGARAGRLAPGPREVLAC